GKIGGKGIGILVDEEIYPALSVHCDLAVLVLAHRSEAHQAEQLTQLVRAAGGGSEFDELETVDALRVFERGDMHTGVWLLGAHGRAPGDARKPAGHRRFRV